MFELLANKTELTVRQREPTTSGSVGIYMVRFQFTREWAGLEKIACFRSGSQVISVLLDETGECAVPHEVTDPDDKGKHLYVGVYGTNGGAVVLPTVWADLGVIQEGAYCGSNANPPPQAVWAQALARKQDKLTGLPGQFVGFDADGSAVASDLPEGGTTDHRALTHREDEGAHPIEAITGLGRELSKRVEAGDALSVADIIKIMEG